MKTIAFIILIIVLWSVLFFAAGYKWRDHQPQQGFTCQFSGSEWTELTSFENVKAAREYLNENSVNSSDPISKPRPVEILKVSGDIGGSNIFTKKAGNYYHFEGYKPNAFKPYSVSVKDEHSVILTANNDTIVLYLENATNMAEEKLIYILPAKE